MARRIFGDAEAFINIKAVHFVESGITELLF